MARKPSPTREPVGAMSKTPDSDKSSLAKIASREDFDLVARVYHKDTPFELPHAMFVIDRRSKNRIYFVNSQKYRYHKDFLLARYLVPRGADVFKPVYIDQDRRFIVGTIAWQKSVEKFTWELWEGDLASSELIKLAGETINKNFYTPVAYKPNSIRQEDASAELGIERVLQSDISKNQDYLALNTGVSIGRLHIIDKLDDTVEIGSNEILVLKEFPLSLAARARHHRCQTVFAAFAYQYLSERLGHSECLYQRCRQTFQRLRHLVGKTRRESQQL